MEALVLPVISVLDRCRVQALRWGLSLRLLRVWFYDRPARLGFLYALTVLIYLPLSLYFPLWILAIGPFIWGVPHLFSSFRYQSLHSSTKAKPLFYFIFIIWLVSFLFRLGTDVFQWNLEFDISHPGVIEAILAAAMAIGLFFFRGFSSKKIFSTVIVVGTLLYFSWCAPVATAGVLILAHNFVAFFYWIRFSPTLRDRQLAIGATVIFATIHILVLCQVFDNMINWVAVESLLSWAQLDIDSLGQAIAPWSQDGNLFYRLVVLYAFGQSLHYFVWMKAIPDLFSNPQAPTSFRTSWSFLKKDLGFKVIVFALTLFAIPLVAWLLHSFPVASQIYFAAAAFHGYLELAGIGTL